jgi:hypothetical protein
MANLKFQTPEELEAAIETYWPTLETWAEEVVEYFDEELDRKVTVKRPYLVRARPPTLAGLADHLGVFHTTLRNYKGREDFVAVVSRALNRIAMFAEEGLYDKQMVTGAQFALRVNHGYRDADAEKPAGAEPARIIAPSPQSPVRAITKWGDQPTEENDQ